MGLPRSTVVVGNFGLEGCLSSDEVKGVLDAGHFKSWMFLLAEDDPSNPEAAVKAAGLQFNCVPVSVPAGLTAETASNVVESLNAMEKPSMIQCASGGRASAVMLIQMGKELGLSAEKCVTLGNTLQLPCMAKQPLVNWIKSALPSELKFRQLFDSESSTYTYILGDSGTKDAIIIDPVVGQVERDVQVLKEMGLNLQYAINTHCHADHITGTGKLKGILPGVKSGISAASGAAADIHYSPGDKIQFGGHQLEVRATPGHTNGCVTYYTTSGGGLAFTGDAVLIRGCGRTDFQEGSPETLYESVHSHIFSLPNNTKIYPAHDYKGRTSSTVEEEKKFNLRLTKSKEEFVNIMNNLGLKYPKLIDVAVPSNLKCGIED